MLPIATAGLALALGTQLLTGEPAAARPSEYDATVYSELVATALHNLGLINDRCWNPTA